MRSVEDGLWRSILNHPAFIHEHYLVGDAAGGLLVPAQRTGAGGPPDPVEDGAHAARWCGESAQRVEPAGRP